jgi:lipopolysaccharide transport system permease protein
VLSKVYFPRLALPIATVLPALADFGVAFMALLAMMAWFGLAPGWNAIWLPAILLLPIGAAFGTGLILSAYNVEYRDVRHLLPLALQFLLLASPIAYPASLVSGTWRALFALNPMVGAIEAFRWALLGTPAASRWDLAASAAFTAALIVGGVVCFKLREPRFTDLV